MRVAVIAQQASAGGGTRFLRPLVRSLAETYRDLKLTIYVNAQTAELFGADAGLTSKRITVVPIDPILSAHPASELTGQEPVSIHRGIRERLGRPFERPPMMQAAFELALAASKHDVVYLAWPYFLHPMELTAPVVGTFHDFNYKRDLGTLGEDFVRVLEQQVGFWLRRCEVAVTSSQFIADEIDRFYPGVANEVRVVRLATLLTSVPDAAAICAARARAALPEEYVICPSNTARHKNLERLLRAYAAVRAAGGPPLVLIGNGTQLLADAAPGAAADPTARALHEALAASGLQLGSDIFALGYVSDADADALIAGARLLVAPSRYEAGSGPALDAWRLGTPVAFSAIPPFLEQLEVFGVEAATFDPESEQDIARSVLGVLAQGEAAREGAIRSRAAVEKYAEAQVAEGYRAAFEAAVRRRR